VKRSDEAISRRPGAISLQYGAVLALSCGEYSAEETP
jgi:hypothetical protein